MSEVLETTAARFVWDIRALDPSDGRRFGGKATGLARMVAAGIPAPPAFAIGTDAFHAFHANGRRLPDDLRRQVNEAMARLGAQAGRRFGVADAGELPLLVSVRSGAQVSMPGMMDTVLNLGLDAGLAAKMIACTGAREFVIDSWLRFWKMYAEIVLGLDGDDLVDDIAPQRAAAIGGEIDLETLEAAVVAHILSQGEAAPTDPRAQLDQTISAVFASWDSPRAKAYRQHHGIADDLGTAVTVQAMVFGNADDNSGSGVAFSRNPNDGDPALYGEYLAGRQGEDIVSGAKTPIDLSRCENGYAELRAKLDEHSRALERLYGDAVDIEFTVESGKLYLLQVRPAKRTAEAAVRIAADLVEEGLVDSAAGLKRVSAEQVKRLLRPVFDPAKLAEARSIAKGIGSSPGQASGVAIFDSDRAAERAAAGEAVILVRPTTSPLDIRGMIAADGILTARGGALSHAAVVSRALDKPCIVGCETIEIDPEEKVFVAGGKRYREGDWIAIDGASGLVYAGAIDLIAPAQGARRLSRLLEKADALSHATIWTATHNGGEAVQMRGAGCARALTGMTDFALATGSIERLIDCVSRIGRPNAATEIELGEIAGAIAAKIFETACAPINHIRLPRLASERARSLIPGWSDLDPRLFLPLGNPAFYRPLLHGLSQASLDQDAPITVLIGGVTDVGEWRRFRNEAEAFPNLAAGVTVQNVACLDAAPAMLAEGATLWLDMDEILLSAHGFVPEHYLVATALDDYVHQGLMSANPRSALKPFLASLLNRLANASDAAERVGVDCGAGCDLGLLRALYREGFRTFGVPPCNREVVCLVLGQEAAFNL
ncbi:pyruvate phosphate dikinase PEP/pyruvate-binding [Methylocella silvestris BL2]|uniref:Pyruvate phosphate dikinase PEP/pyruvate-binding n=1 Tax=Methylocella silvestris (strain DSM 15510 / CIP 108128 / LMG 27833 / NCIMB 13906 / BL2) TaxID=395965 RepID=B8ETI5_METSB|nr:pyruvate, phosphate dikinase [Methylocella silvestris]ACK52337.1 pyruvate phosphate dikinase PEP/pyruvate-binding [Methylocella silvestris BL2]